MSLPHALLSSLLAFGTQWPIIDLPYPDVDRLGAGGAVASVEAQVEEAVARYARSRAVPPIPAARKPEISQLRIDGARATALLTTGDRSERVQLQLLDREWRVVKEK